MDEIASLMAGLDDENSETPNYITYLFDARELAAEAEKECPTSTQVLQDLLSTVRSLDNTLQETEAEFGPEPLNSTYAADLEEILLDSHRILHQVWSFAKKYRSWGLQAQNVWNLKSGNAGLINRFQLDLKNCIDSLLEFQHMFGTFEEKLEKLVRDIQAGNRSGSPLSRSSLTQLENNSEWQLLAKELEKAGISPWLIEKRRVIITKWIQDELARGVVTNNSRQPSPVIISDLTAKRPKAVVTEILVNKVQNFSRPFPSPASFASEPPSTPIREVPPISLGGQSPKSVRGIPQTPTREIPSISFGETSPLLLGELFSLPVRETSPASQRNSSQASHMNNSPVPAGSKLLVSDRETFLVPGKDTSSITSRGTSPISFGETRSLLSRESSPAPSRDKSPIPSRDSSPMPSKASPPKNKSIAPTWQRSQSDSAVTQAVKSPVVEQPPARNRRSVFRKIFGNAEDTARTLILKGDESGLAKLFKNHRDLQPNTIIRPGLSLFDLAAAEGTPGMCQLLIDHGGVVSYDTLYQAVSNEREPTVKLLSKVADIDQMGKKGSLLYEMAFEGRLSTVQLLLRCGANANQQGGQRGSPLCAAISTRHTEIAKALLDAGADVNLQGGLYGNALCAAASTRNMTMARMLIDAGAQLSTGEDHYGNGLAAATIKGDTKMVELLLEGLNNTTSKASVAGDALYAAACNGKTEIAKMLIDAGTDVNWQTGTSDHALAGAALAGHMDVVTLLLEHGAEVNKRESNNVTTLTTVLAEARLLSGSMERLVDRERVSRLQQMAALLRSRGAIANSPLSM